MDQGSTDRRNFLKTGALVAAPLAVAAAPAAVLAEDGSRGRLSRLEDENALRALHRQALGQVNRGERRLGDSLGGLAEDPRHELQIAFADDGRTASCRRVCTATFRTDFTGTSTIEQMHRLQGQGLHSHDEERVLVTDYSKGKDGWEITGARLA